MPFWISLELTKFSHWGLAMWLEAARYGWAEENTQFTYSVEFMFSESRIWRAFILLARLLTPLAYSDLCAIVWAAEHKENWGVQATRNEKGAAEL